MRGRICFIVVMALSAPAWPCEAPEGPAPHVTHLKDGLTLVLDTDETILLAGLYMPLAPEAPLARDARKALETLLRGKRVRLLRTASEPDRYGRLQAHVFAGNEGKFAWVQGAMLNAGWAQVVLPTGNLTCADEMLIREAAARKARKGLWAHKAYTVLDATQKDMPRGFFRIVEGTVASAAVRGKVVYINFGRNWRTDFTVRAEGLAIAKALGAAGLTPEKLRGARLRVRGWIEDWNGPMIKLTHLGQMEVVATEMQQP